MSYVTIEQSEAVTEVILDRPPLNVVDRQAIDDLGEAFAGLRGSDCKVVVLRSVGDTFCAGADIGDHLPGPVDEMIPAFVNLFRGLWSLEQPTVAIVQGKALGGGMELALGCDFVIASEDAEFGQPEIKVGVFPPIACLVLPRRLPWAEALDLILTGRTIDAADAKRLGLVNVVAAADELDEAASSFVRRLTRKSGPVLRVAKGATAVGRGGDEELEAALTELERLYLEDLMGLEDPVEGLTAFTEGRRPEWKEC